ncbi:hypothetical protein M5689_018242 [Euphorbia peplus]|nr:hypothetical protein M5689_018242 [Euphorbia peplus]
MAKSLSQLIYLRPKPMSFSSSSYLIPSNPKCMNHFHFVFPISRTLLFSTTSTPYPFQYDMIISRPTHPPPPHPPRRPPKSHSTEDTPISEPGLDSWVDDKLSLDKDNMDKSMRKYYNKRRKRMYGSDSDDNDTRNRDDGFVELKPEIAKLRSLHKREEELYFYDTFCYPWEKDKHYKMVYQLEKKYFPDQCLDKAFLHPQHSNFSSNAKPKRSTSLDKDDKGVTARQEDERFIFFDDKKDEPEAEAEADSPNTATKDVVTERKVEDFFKCLKKVPNNNNEITNAEPYLVTRSTELPPKWDGPYGTVVLVNKPKGWTSFTVCGKLRRLVKVKKVGHAGTLDPMATGLLIVCVGKATKVVDRYQGMVKGYSGVFRLGEATSTWDADSPVIQREPWEHIRDEDIRKAASSFSGEIWQVPPMFSAIKVGGEKMYEKARRGESIELAPRRISIFQFDIERSLEDRQNLIFRVICSKGTYIRSLCADLGKAVGSCAHLTALRRDSIGEYSADDAWEFNELEEAINKNYF